MRFVILRKADPDTEAGRPPGEDLLAAMGDYNQDLAARGRLLGGEGLRPTADGARVEFRRGEPVVTDGPFAETRELIAGFTLIKADSLAEAVEHAKRWPPLDGQGAARLEVRRLFELSDFAPGDGLATHEATRDRLARQPRAVTPYLFFDGRCREAFELYADCFGGSIELMLPYRGSPAAETTPPHWQDKIMHAQVRAGDWLLMGSDPPAEWYTPPRGGSVHVQFAEIDMAAAVFDRLAEGGEVRMAFAETFWARRFGMLVDRFGVPWMLSVDRPA
jgi:PhnB protein